MARRAMVTRAFKGTKVNVLCLDTESKEACNKVVTLGSTFANAEKCLKAAKKLIDTDTIKAVSIVSADEIETLYGMDVDKFIANAVELDLETRKEIEEVSAEATEE